MESIRYWRDFGVVMARMAVNEQGRSGAAPAHDSAGQRAGEVVHGRRAISLDVYLAVPTFIRRGITICGR